MRRPPLAAEPRADGKHPSNSTSSRRGCDLIKAVRKPNGQERWSKSTSATEWGSRCQAVLPRGCREKPPTPTLAPASPTVRSWSPVPSPGVVRRHEARMAQARLDLVECSASRLKEPGRRLCRSCYASGWRHCRRCVSLPTWRLVAPPGLSARRSGPGCPAASWPEPGPATPSPTGSTVPSP